MSGRHRILAAPGSAPARRVLYVINDLAFGGAQRVVLSHAAALDRARFVPEVASLELIPDAALAPAFADAGIPVHRLRSAREPRLAGMTRLLPLVRALHPDLVHTHLAAAGVAGRVSARLAGVPAVVSTLHNLSDWEERRSDPLRRLERRTLVLADQIIAVSGAVRDALARVSPALAPRTVTVHNGVALEPIVSAGERAAARAALGYGDDAFVVGSVARLDRRKGLDTLLDAVALARHTCPALRVMVVGEGAERQALERRTASLGLGDVVRWIGHRARVRSYLAAMDVFAAPSRTEGLGLAIIEALGAGLPALASRVGGIPEVVRDGECGALLPPEAPEAWATALASLAGDPARRRVWALAGPRVAARFSLERCARDLESVYATACHGAPHADEELLEVAA